MKKNKQEIWVGLDEKLDPKSVAESSKNEFHTELPVIDALSNNDFVEKATTTRRDFMKYLGFGVGAAVVAASCEMPVRNAVPYITQPDSIVPGVPTYYASTYINGGEYCSVLVKTREGRPIKIEGNSLSPISKGGTSARAQASILSLYDTSRLQGPVNLVEGKAEKTTWKSIDDAVKSKLTENSNVRIITGTVMSPSMKSVIADFTKTYPNTKHVAYDTTSYAAILDSNLKTFGKRILPNYHFDKAKVIVSFDADFLGTWISPVEYSADYVKNRVIKDDHHPEMSHHVQVESRMSLTGSNSDNRILVKPSEQGAAIASLYKYLGGNINAPEINDKAAKAILKVAKKLKNAKGQSLVVAGSNNITEQLIINKINNLLGNYGTTIDFAHASLQYQGSDVSVFETMKEMSEGKIDAVFFLDSNPVFDLPEGKIFAEAMKKVSLKVSLNQSIDETAIECNFIAPNHHFLESWGDVEAKYGQFSFIQPTIEPLFDTRQAGQSFLVWSGNAVSGEQPYMNYVKEFWKSNMFPRQNKYLSFQTFWDRCLHDGVYNIGSLDLTEDDQTAFAFNDVQLESQVAKPINSEMEISFYEMVGVGSGAHANNPWLQEMPDPIMRTVWGNFLGVHIGYNGSDAYNSFNGLKDGDNVSVKVGNTEFAAAIVNQFGQMEGTTSIGIGFGREVIGQAGMKVGANVQSALSRDKDGYVQYFSSAEVSSKTGEDKDFAIVQYHHTYGVTSVDETEEWVDEKVLGMEGSLERRSVMYHSNLNKVHELIEEIGERREEAQYLNSKSLYSGHDELYDNGHHWSMHIDLNACTGCGACTVSCMAENNVPVVGKHEVHRHHEMTWLRIDRYYYGNVENPNVVYQPMMCQHCDNAPCENVCPVNATNHSSEGLNQMAYNRCIGTRYCANNCPFKVRRFNWLDYTTGDLFANNEYSINGEDLPYGADNLTRMVLNPDVTVRSRGVIEKCSLCVQRIQQGKLTAKIEGRELEDKDVKPACATACATDAITFGDDNNPKSEVNGKLKSSLNFIVLEEINVKSAITYRSRINNRDESYDV